MIWWIIFSVGLFVICKRLIAIYRLMFEDRNGNSGRMKHWTEE